MNTVKYSIFDYQNIVVVQTLMEQGYSNKDAVELWQHSETRKYIQEKRKLFGLKPEECLAELERERNGSPLWLKLLPVEDK